MTNTAPKISQELSDVLGVNSSPVLVSPPVTMKSKKNVFEPGNTYTVVDKFSLRNLWHGLWSPSMLFYTATINCHSSYGDLYLNCFRIPKNDRNIVRVILVLVVLLAIYIPYVIIQLIRVLTEAIVYPDKKFRKRREITKSLIDAAWREQGHQYFNKQLLLFKLHKQRRTK